MSQTDQKAKQRSIRLFVLLPLLITMGVAVGAFIFLYFFERNVDTTGMEADVRTSINQIEVQMTNRYEAFDNTYEMVKANVANLFEGNEGRTDIDFNELMAKDFQRTVRANKYSGYLFADTDHDVIHTNFDIENFDSVILAKLWDNIEASDTPIKGIGLIAKGSLVNMTGFKVYDNEQRYLGMVLFIGLNLADPVQVRRMSDLVQMDLQVFDTIQCVGVSHPDKYDKSTLKPATGAKAASARKETWQGMTAMFGGNDFVGSYPLVRYTGETVGFIQVKGDRTDIDNNAARRLTIVGILCLAFIAIAVILDRFMRRTIVQPTQKLAEELTRVSTGDLTVVVKEDKFSCREVVDIEQATKNMIDRVGGIVRNLSLASGQLADNAGQLSAAAESFSNAANQQAAGLEEIASSMQQMEGNIKQNTENSVKTNHLSEQMGAMTDELKQASQVNFTGVQNIAKDIAAINALVSQTNILALNASVESARAGRHGAGFAIVAKEVGRLADQTKSTAENINVTAGDCIREAGQANQHVEGLAPMIIEVASNVKEITAASVEQSSGIAQMNTAVEELNKITQENAAGAEEIAASITTLNDLVVDFRKAVAQFKI